MLTPRTQTWNKFIILNSIYQASQAKKFVNAGKRIFGVVWYNFEADKCQPELVRTSWVWVLFYAIGAMKLKQLNFISIIDFSLTIQKWEVIERLIELSFVNLYQLICWSWDSEIKLIHLACICDGSLHDSK